MVAEFREANHQAVLHTQSQFKATFTRYVNSLDTNLQLIRYGSHFCTAKQPTSLGVTPGKN